MKKIYSAAVTALCAVALMSCASTKKVPADTPMNTSTETGFSAITADEMAKATGVEMNEKNALANFADAVMKDGAVVDKDLTITTDPSALELVTTGDDKAVAVNFNLNGAERTNKISFTTEKPMDLSSSFVTAYAYIPWQLAYMNKDGFNSSIKITVNGKETSISGVNFMQIGAGWTYLTLNFQRGTYSLGSTSGTLTCADNVKAVTDITAEVEGKVAGANLNVPVVIDYISITTIPEK